MACCDIDRVPKLLQVCNLSSNGSKMNFYISIYRGVVIENKITRSDTIRGNRPLVDEGSVGRHGENRNNLGVIGNSDPSCSSGALFVSIARVTFERVTKSICGIVDLKRSCHVVLQSNRIIMA